MLLPPPIKKTNKALLDGFMMGNGKRDQLLTLEILGTLRLGIFVRLALCALDVSRDASCNSIDRG